MANDFAARPIKVDTVMAGGAGIGRPLRVQKVYWYNPTTAGNLFVIVDPVSNKVLLQGRAEANNQSQTFEFARPVRWKDFRVSTLEGTGILFIYTV